MMNKPMKDAGLGFLALGALALFVVMMTVPVRGVSLLVTQIGMIAGLYAAYCFDGGFHGYRKKPMFRIGISLLTMALTIRYVTWRVTDTIPYGYGDLDVAFGVLLVVAEAHGMISSAVGQVTNVMPLDRKALPLPEDPSDLPKVDILIPTYNEDPEIVGSTVIGATQMRYPEARYRVWILDDGGTNAKCGAPGTAGERARERAGKLKDIAERYGAGYLTRNGNEHAKAGNLNAALQHIDGDLILVLDCDHVPTEDFLRRTVGFFTDDPKLFLLQTPHNFVTADPIERNLSTYKVMPAENELFYSVMQPGLDFWGASFFCGSAAVIRRAALDEIGGISGRTITEDAETTIKAMQRGWRTAYYNRPMVSGLQPETFSGFILQRVRWAQGMIQIFMLENVWFKPGLSFMQKVFFTNFAFYWLFPLARAILLLMPPMFLFFGFNVAVTTPRGLLIFAAPYYLATLLNTQYFYGRVRWPFFAQVYETAQSVFLTIGVISAIRRPKRPTFSVTPKGEMLENDFVSKLIWPFYGLALLNMISIAVGLWRFTTQPTLRDALMLVGVWVILDTLTIMTVIGALSERRQTRKSPRASRREPVLVRVNTGAWHPAKTGDLSRYGANVRVDADIGEVGVDDYIELFFKRRGMSLLGHVRNVTLKEGKLRIGLEYELEAAADDRFAVRLAFGDSATIVGQVIRRHTGLSTPRSIGFLMRVAGQSLLRHVIMSIASTRRSPAAPATRSGVWAAKRRARTLAGLGLAGPQSAEQTLSSRRTRVEGL